MLSKKSSTFDLAHYYLIHGIILEENDQQLWGETKKKSFLRIYQDFMSVQAVETIILTFIFWNMSLNNYTRCPAQPPEKHFCYYSVLNKNVLS